MHYILRTEWELNMYSHIHITHHLWCVNFYKEQQIIPALLVGVYKKMMEGVRPVGISLQR